METTETRCRICGNGVNNLFTHSVLGKHEVQYFECPNCGYVQTQTPTWLAEAYAAPINVEDTGILARNLYIADMTSAVLMSLFGANGKYLDYAGGYGIMTRHMRDIGFDFSWQDNYTQNLLARGFEHVPGTKYSAVTALEVFEHMPEPMAEVSNLLSFADVIICSTELVPTPTPAPDDWVYYGFSHGQHVGIFRLAALQHLAEKLGMRVYSNGINLHVLAKPSTVPQVLAKRDYNNILAKAGEAGRQLLKQSYAPLKFPASSWRPDKYFKHQLAMRVMGKYVTLKPDADVEALAKIFEVEDLLSHYLPSLLQEPSRSTRMLRNRLLTPKTNSDMLEMKQQRLHISIFDSPPEDADTQSQN